MANQTINGRVLLAQSNLPVEGMRIELWDSGNIYGLISSVYSNVEGNFSFIINDPAASLISNNTITPLYKTLRGDVLINNTAANVQGELHLTITENTYDVNVPLNEPNSASAYLLINGRVSDSKNISAPDLTISLYENGFRNQILIAQSVTDINGRYEIKISTKALTNTKVIAKRSIILKAASGDTTVAVSNDIYWNDEQRIEVNLASDNSYTAPSFHENLLSKINYILGDTTFESFATSVEFPASIIVDPTPGPSSVNDLVDITTGGNSSNPELDYIANAIGHDVSEIRSIVRSYQFAVESTTGHDFMHALSCANGINSNPLLNLNEQSMRDTLAKSIGDNLIPSHTTGEIDTFIAAAKSFQVTAGKNIPISGENLTLGQILNSIFTGSSAQADTDEFLTHYNNQYDDINDFWAAFSGVNATNAEKAKRGLRLSSITGFQPEIISDLMGQTGSGLHVLAEKSESDWRTYIDTICTQANKLCVPHSIVGNSTDADAVKTLYAKKLKSVIQDIYPLTAMKVKLSDSGQGPALIADSGIRTQVTTFLANNPDFDLRVSNIYDINDTNESVVLTGVTNAEAVQQALGPMQRLLRVVGGNPDAVATMIVNGHDSAAAIADMSAESFSGTYAAALGGASGAAMVYSRALVVSHTAAMTTASTYALMAGGGGAIPGGGTGGAIPSPAPGWTPGGSSSGPHADPTISTLFGSLSYCACEQCLSMYSPAAYLTDILNFIRQGSSSTAVYAELMRRRPDLEYIDMTCKNTNTVMPYIDLVNELFERLIIYTFNATPPLSYQTRGTAKELAAHPEHVYKDPGTFQYIDYTDYHWVYDPFPSSGAIGTKNLTTEVYPFNLPFSLAAEETRTYLNYLGTSRYELMKLYQPYTAPTPNPITDFDIYSEYIGLTEAEATIVISTHALSGSTWLFYGFPGTTISVIDPTDTTLTITGFWRTCLTTRLDLLIQQLRISYKQFLQFLTTDFLNKRIVVGGVLQRQVTVASTDSSVPDTCDLSKLMLVFPDTGPGLFFDKLHRFVRLWRTNRLGVEDWDRLFTALNITGTLLTDNSLYTQAQFALVVRVLQLMDRTGLSVTDISGWWGYMDTHQYVDYRTESQDKTPSTYDLAYRNMSVINLPLPDFADLGDWDQATTFPSASLPAYYTTTATPTPPALESYTAQIAAASSLKESELLLILGFMGVPLSSAVTFDVLSTVYTFSRLCKKLGYAINDLLEIFYISDVSLPVSSTSGIAGKLDKFDSLLNIIDDIRHSGFDLVEIDYLVRNVGERGPVAPAPLNIEIFYEKLRNELQKFPIYAPASPPTADDTDLLNKLTNVIYQFFSKEFNVSSDWANLIITNATPLGGPSVMTAYFTLTLVEVLIREETVTSTTDITEQSIIDLSWPPPPGSPSGTPPIPVNCVGYLYQNYRWIYKVVMVAKRLRLNTYEFEYLFPNSAISFDFKSMFTVGVLTSPSYIVTILQGLLRLTKWTDIRDKFSLIEDQLVILLKAADDDPHGTTYTANLATWQSVINRDIWGSMLVDLVGDSTTLGSTPVAKGLLNATFPTDYDPANDNSLTNFWGIISIISTCQRTGLKPKTLQKVLFQDLVLSDSHQVLQAAKGKHTEDEWAAIAKPLRDTLRRKQRDALVGFILSYPDPGPSGFYSHYPVSGSKMVWRNENDLYAFFLIDPEMETCMQTSRIKQAISSVQLYVDRVLLGLECVNTSVGSRITLSPTLTFQWRQWREWYRIWEANRMVFLYPENWIEPELRDDKSVFFEEMEAILMQGDITIERVEDAMIDYLRKLDSVARLEPIGVCDTVDTTGKVITYAFARTYTDPHQYFYRRLKDYQWEAWDRIEIDIKSEQVAPVFHNNRLYIFWLTFREKSVIGRASEVSSVIAHTGGANTKWFYNDKYKPNSETSVNDPIPGSSGAPVYVKQLEITLNWSEFKDGQWQEQKVGKDKMFLDLNPIIHQYFPEIFAGGFAASVDTGKYNFLSKMRSTGLVEFMISRFKLYALSQGELALEVVFPIDFYINSLITNDDGRHIEIFFFANGNPYVARDGNGGAFPNIISPDGTFFSNNRFVQLPQSYGGAAPFKINNTVIASVAAYQYYWETNWNENLRKSSGGPVTILNSAPNGIFKIVDYSNTWMNPLEKGFFYYDDQNTFFARVINSSTFPTSSSPVSIAAAGYDAARYYIAPAYQPTVYSSGVINLTTAHVNINFYFQTFFHPRVKDFISAFNNTGIDGFLNIQSQDQNDIMNFSGSYHPNGIVYAGPSGSSAYPSNKVDFDFAGTYSIYNWELFFHTPLLIAKRLSDNQQFDDARKWFHYIFDPTCNVDASGTTVTGSKQRFWRFRPFYDLAGLPIETLDDLMIHINAGIASAVQQVQLWSNDPFKPHLIARMRILAYMKNVVMCYLDNLIAWGDQLYRQDTIESINQATNLYILAANILGPKPEEVPQRVEAYPRNFHELTGIGLDAFGNAMVGIEHYIDPNSPAFGGGGWTGGTPPPLPKMFYFCLPNNPKLLAYWDTVASRLFNIRNCRNIDGQAQQLPLFEPPIDPALLVRAAAAGLDASSVLDDLSSPPMPYKFTVMLQKANELCNDVKALGGALISAIEKKDAEALAVLRSGQEIKVMESMKLMKQAQIDEASASINAAAKLKDAVQARYDYYSSRPYKSAKEIQHIALMDQSQQHQNTASTLSATAAVLAIIPEINFQLPMALGPSFGGRELSAVCNALSTIQAQKAAQKSAEATKTLTEAGYERRMDDWQFQAQAAQKELGQIDKQVIAAQMRKAVAVKDLATQEVQIANARETDEFMRNKYTNVELYNWMITQISTTYFQAYQLAYDVAKRAEKCLTYELPLISIPGTGFIKFGYWDSLKKGLYSAEKLQYDLRKMELAYLESNKRELELTKHISLMLNDPQSLLQLRETGMCSIICTQDMFNMDFPGHYLRRVKSISISIPCVAGPYTTVGAMLTQSSAGIEDSAGTLTGAATSQYPITTSSAQNDSGMFELNFRDDRYLPFEGTGAICTWNLSLMAEKDLRQFDYNTISDVILHVKYTAQYDNTKDGVVTTSLHNRLDSLSGATPIDLPVYFSLKHQFANAWFAYANAITGTPATQMVINMDSKLFPFFCQRKNITIKSWHVLLRSKAMVTGHAYEIDVDYGSSSGSISIDPTTHDGPWSLTPAAVITPGSGVSFALSMKDMTLPLTPLEDMNSLLDDILLVATYNLS